MDTIRLPYGIDTTEFFKCHNPPSRNGDLLEFHNVIRNGLHYPIAELSLTAGTIEYYHNVQDAEPAFVDNFQIKLIK